MAPTCGFLMEKATSNNQEPHPHPHPSQLHGLRCPRCDSSNTKFCYYNNYSLSQPRHFCKACKRYWTRGGSLRNVPVGGGCRKNKRVKKQPSSSSSPELTTNNNTNTNPSFSNPTTYTISSGPSNLNPLFFGFNPRVSSSSMDGFDYLQPQLDSLGLGFSSAPTSTSYGVSDNGFSSINSLLVPPNYCSPTMATLLASSFKGDTIKSPLDQFQTFSGKPLDGLQVHGNNGVKMEPGQKLQVDWSLSYHQEEHQLGFSSDPNSFYWHDPANLGPSVTSLI